MSAWKYVCAGRSSQRSAIEALTAVVAVPSVTRNVTASDSSATVQVPVISPRLPVVVISKAGEPVSQSPDCLAKV